MKIFLKKFFISLAESYQSYCSNRNHLKYVGIVGTIGYPLFYFIYTKFLVQPYDNITIRSIATTLCFFLLIEKYWPDKIKRFYYAYSYFTIMYCLPFFHVFMSLKNDGNIVFIADSLMAAFFLVLLTDWRNTIVMLLAGSLSGSLLYVFTTENPTLPVEYVSRLPTLLLIVIGGSLFKFSEKQIQIAKDTAFTALAGSIAHEMRNPLGRMKYALNHINQMLPTPDTSSTQHVISAKTINNIYTSIAQGLTSCNRGLQVIDITLHEVSNQELDPTTFEYLSAATVTEKALEEYSFESQAERNKVTLHILNDFIFKVDESAYIYIIFNLIKNALYYFKSHPNACIKIVIDIHKITVSDTGPGIPKDILNSLFKSFTTSGKANGTGLGLAYCYRSMEAFGGQIHCDSIVDQFTEFTLTFPDVPDEELEAHTIMVFNEVIPFFKHKRILVVDDQVIYHSTVRHVVEGFGCQIIGAENGQTAIDMLRTHQFDLIIMDLKMPVKDGYIATEEIRAGIIPHQRNIPIVAHTSEAFFMARIKTQKVGMDGFVSKPCTPLEFIKAILQAFQCARQRCNQEPTSNTLAGKTMLIADDELFNRQYLEIYAKEWGMNTLHADSGKAVLDILENAARVDIIVMDMRMPVMSGAEATRRIRSNPACQHIIIVALTGNYSEQAIEEAKMAGMDAFVNKPFDKVTLQKKLISLIATKDHKGQKSVLANAPVNQHFDDRYADKFDGNCISFSEKSILPCRKKSPEYIIGTKVVEPMDAPSNRYFPERQSQVEFFEDLQLIDHARLKVSQVNLSDNFQNFLQSIVKNLIARDKELQIGFDNNDVDAITNSLHSFLGIAGYACAHALHQYIKLRLYPAVATGRYPDDEAWIETVHALVKNSVEVLRRDWVTKCEETE